MERSISVPASRKAGEACPSMPPPPAVPECAICLQTCVHPVSLPCRHVFCYLCVKGASWLGRRCALCRQDIPEDFLDRPTLLCPEELKAASRGTGEYAWYYEGRNGWWQYDERTSRELEEALARGKKSAEMLIAGALYVADLENMVQYRRNEHGRRRRMKRDLVGIPKKGVAGLRLDCDAAALGLGLARESSADGADSGPTPAPSAATAQPPAAPSTPDTPDTPDTLGDALAQLQLDGSHRGEGEDERQPPPPGRVPTPDTPADEPESGASSSDGEGLSARGALQRPPGPTSHAAPERAGQPGPAPGSGPVRVRRPDGQCTVTEV